MRFFPFALTFLLLVRVMDCTSTMRTATTGLRAGRGRVTARLGGGMFMVQAAPQRGVRKNLHNDENGEKLFHVTSCCRYSIRATSLLSSPSIRRLKIGR